MLTMALDMRPQIKKSKYANHKKREIMDKMMFKNQELKYEGSDLHINEKTIIDVIPPKFQGRTDFVEFYLYLNGIFFPDSADITTNYFINPIDGEEYYYTLSVDYFYDIDSIKKYQLTLKESFCKEFIEDHFIFARNPSGNEFFIEIPSGKIKYVDWEEWGTTEAVIDVANNFKEFCDRLEPHI